MGFDVTRATILFDKKPDSVDEIRLIFTKTDKRVTKRNYLDSAVFPPLVKGKSGWHSTIIPLNPLGIVTHIDLDDAYARVKVYPEKSLNQSGVLTLRTRDG